MSRETALFLLALFATLVLAAPPAQAQQGLEQPELNAYAGLSAPTGDFSDDSGSGAGYASFGFGAMLEYVYPLGTPGLGWVSSASLLINSADEDLFDPNADAGFYGNVPLLSGLRYRTELSPTLDGYALGQAGLNVVRGPSGELGESEVNPGISTSFGFAFGAGIVLNDGINITARYLRLGEPEIEYEVDSPNATDEVEYETSISVFQVMIGIPI